MRLTETQLYRIIRSYIEEAVNRKGLVRTHSPEPDPNVRVVTYSTIDRRVLNACRTRMDAFKRSFTSRLSQLEGETPERQRNGLIALIGSLADVNRDYIPKDSDMSPVITSDNRKIPGKRKWLDKPSREFVDALYSDKHELLLDVLAFLDGKPELGIGVLMRTDLERGRNRNVLAFIDAKTGKEIKSMHYPVWITDLVRNRYDLIDYADNVHINDKEDSTHIKRVGNKFVIDQDAIEREKKAKDVNKRLAFKKRVRGDIERGRLALPFGDKEEDWEKYPAVVMKNGKYTAVRNAVQDNQYLCIKDGKPVWYDKWTFEDGYIQFYDKDGTWKAFVGSDLSDIMVESFRRMLISRIIKETAGRIRGHMLT